ncbi:MAG TPA: hypothetical protein VLT57_10985 [Bryobacteraceae bacterium]|nr:hypothetical protein [Bryobacteraceae bacterium]
MGALSSLLAAVCTGGVSTGLLQGQEPGIAREGSYWIETVQGSLPGAAPVRLRIQAEGAVVLRGGSAQSVHYSVKKRVRARNAQEARERLRVFRVRTARDGNLARLEFLTSGSPLAGVDVSITAFSDIRWSEIETKAGSISVTGMNGQVNVQTGAGRIDLDAIRGEASARTGGGDLQIGHLAGALRCYTGGGSVHVGTTGGITRIETAGGDIFLQDAGGPVSAITGGGNIHVGKAASSVSARTSAGLIDVRDAGGPVIADTSGGVIEINSAHGAQCASTAGAIRLRNVNGNVRAATRTGSILAELLASRPFADSTLSASLGDVTVMIPSNIAMTVVARNESAGAMGRIVSDFPEIRVKLANSGAPGPAVAEGMLNGGGPVLHISVAAGNIYLKRQR